MFAIVVIPFQSILECCIRNDSKKKTILREAKCAFFTLETDMEAFMFSKIKKFFGGKVLDLGDSFVYSSYQVFDGNVCCWCLLSGALSFSASYS